MELTSLCSDSTRGSEPTEIAQALLLKHSVNLLERAVRASSCRITVTDMRLPEQPLIFVNKAFERITGYSCADVIGTNCRFLQGPDRQQAGLDELRSALKSGTDCSVTLQNYRKESAADGTLCGYSYSVTKDFDPRFGTSS